MAITSRLKMLCRTGRLLCWFTALGIVGLLAYMTFDRQLLIETMANLDPKLPRQPDVAYLYAAYAVSLFPAALSVAALWLLAALFGRLSAGAFLSLGTETLLRRIGWLAAAAAILGVVTRTTIIFILSLQNPPGERLLSLGLNSNDLMTILLALILFIFAQVQAEMVRLDEDNKSII